MYHLTSIHWRSEYDHTKQIFVNSYPWLFPGGVGDTYNLEQGEIPIKEWGNIYYSITTDNFLKTHYLDYFFIIPSRDTQITEGNFFFKSDRFIGKKTHQLFKN
jgi:hypothetical protein